MRVCNCCYYPMIGNFYFVIIVPDDTPTCDGRTIFPDTLERAGMRWDDHHWLKPDGEMISGDDVGGVYEIAAAEERK